MPTTVQIAARARRWYGYPLASLLLLVPCYWQSRLQAGDLSSHVYNAWLAQLIESGRAGGLAIVRQSTNVLFDILLSGFFKWFGPGPAQRIAVSIAVLTFAWGAFAFVTAVSGRRPWHLMPGIAVLAYGWVFHMGFFNFYLALGLCFWALAIAWNSTPVRLAAAGAVLMLAYVAHALPVLWAAGLLVYVLIARRLTPLYRLGLTCSAIGALAAVHFVTRKLFVTRWSVLQLSVTTGLDQVWVFDMKYYIVLMGALAAGGLFVAGLFRHFRAREVFAGIPLHLCVISAAAIFLLPGTVLVPGYLHALSYIAERMSLGMAICIFALVGGVRPRLLEHCTMTIVAVIFFCFVYADEAALNRFEDRMDAVVAQLPPGERVVSAITDFNIRINSLTHMIDRACIGHCYSYANYEASTGQFRIRAIAWNPYVAHKYADSWHLQTGEYVVTERDLPLYKLDIEHDGRLVARPLKAGAPTGRSESDVLPDLPPSFGQSGGVRGGHPRAGS